VLEEGALPRHLGTVRAGTDMAVSGEGDVWVDQPKCSVMGSH